MAEGDAPAQADIGARLQEILSGQVEGFRAMRADLSLVANEVDTVKERIGTLEERTNAIDGWRKNNSERVRGLAEQTSEHDLTHDAKIASEIVARQALEMKVDGLVAATSAQTAILQRIERLASNPIVKQAATAIGAAILTWLAAKGYR